MVEELEELELLDEDDVDVDVLAELELLAEAWPLFPWPVVPPSNIATASASCDGRLTPSVR